MQAKDGPGASSGPSQTEKSDLESDDPGNAINGGFELRAMGIMIQPNICFCPLAQ